MVTFGARVYDLTKQEYVETTSAEIATSAGNINHLFSDAGRKIGEGLHIDFWQRTVAGIDDVAKIRHAKIEVSVLLSDPAVLEAVEESPEERSDEWRGEHADEIDTLPEKRLAVYADIAGTADKPRSGTRNLSPGSDRRRRHRGTGTSMLMTTALSPTSSTSRRPKL